MQEALLERPVAGDHLPYYDQYIRLVPDGDVVEILVSQIDETAAFLAPLTAEQAQWRPAPGEWNAVEIVGHLADTERVFSYRALRIARADPTPLSGVDFEQYVAAADFAGRSLADVLEEFVAVRRATVAFFRSLDRAAWGRKGVADGNGISVRSIAYILAGHELHHLADLRRYHGTGGAR
jgi:hypothetical protein